MEASTKKKLIFGGLGIGMLLLINRAGQVSDTINGLQFSFGPGGAPRLIGLTGIEWPVKVNVTNAGAVTLPLQGVAMTMEHVLPNGQTTPLAATDPAGVATPNIAARAVTSFVVPVRTSVLDLVRELASIWAAKGLGRYRLSPTIMSAGVAIKLPATILTY